jgi:hypothetical protein
VCSTFSKLLLWLQLVLSKHMLGITQHLFLLAAVSCCTSLHCQQLLQTSGLQKNILSCCIQAQLALLQELLHAASPAMQLAACYVASLSSF